MGRQFWFCFGQFWLEDFEISEHLNKLSIEFSRLINLCVYMLCISHLRFWIQNFEFQKYTVYSPWMNYLLENSVLYLSAKIFYVYTFQRTYSFNKKMNRRIGRCRANVCITTRFSALIYYIFTVPLQKKIFPQQ